MICDTSTDSPHPLVPTTHRQAVFDTLYCLAHSRVAATVKLISARFFWPNTRRDITAWARSCVCCQKSKVHKHISAPLGTFSTPDTRFNHIYIDLVGLWPISRVFDYLLTCIDHITCWPETPRRHFGGICSASPNIGLDIALRNSCNYYHRSWWTVRIPSLP